MEFLFYSEINLLCITLLGIMAYRASKFGIDTNRKKKAFVASIGFAISMNFFDIFRGLYIFPAVEIPFWLCCIICTGYFTSLAMSAFFWLVFSEIIHTEKFGKISLYAILLVPLAALLVLLVTTNMTKWLFYFGENGEFVRGPLYCLQFIPSLLYILISSVKNLIGVLALKHYERHETFVTMFSYSVPTFICAILQFFFQTAPILSVAPTISLLLVYTNSLKIQLSLDSLTGIFNRKALADTLSEKVKSQRKNKKLYFLFIDIDDFKTFNDKYGHNDGDKALQLVADVLNEICYHTGGACARYGGDEFAVVQELDENANISVLCEEIKNAVIERSKAKEFKFPVNVSVGYAEYGKDAQNVPALIRFADKQMYANKKEKAKITASGK